MKRYAPLPRTKARTPIGILKDVVKAIRAEPRRYYQGDWIRAVGPDGDEHYVGHGRGTLSYEDMIAEDPSCGTVGCVAGWVRILTRKPGESRAYFRRLDQSMTRQMHEVVKDAAQRALRLTGRQADSLFSSDPVRFQREVRVGDLRVGTAKYAEAGIRHIERFMRRHMGYTGPKL